MEIPDATVFHINAINEWVKPWINQPNHCKPCFRCILVVCTYKMQENSIVSNAQGRALFCNYSVVLPIRGLSMIWIRTIIFIYTYIYISKWPHEVSVLPLRFLFPDTAKESSFHLLSSGLPWVSQDDYAHSYRPGRLLDQATWSPQAGTCSTGITRSLVAQAGWCLVAPDNPDSSCVLACIAGTLNLCGRLHRRSAIRVGWVG